MKFDITISTGPENRRKFTKIRGFNRLEDAAAAALAIAEVNRGEDCFTTVYLARARGHDSAIIGQAAARWNLSRPGFLDACRVGLERANLERKATEARRDFAGRIEQRFPNAFVLVFGDDTARAALFKNDFATVENFLAETGRNRPVPAG